MLGDLTVSLMCSIKMTIMLSVWVLYRLISKYYCNANIYTLRSLKCDFTLDMVVSPSFHTSRYSSMPLVVTFTELVCKSPIQKRKNKPVVLLVYVGPSRESLPRCRAHPCTMEIKHEGEFNITAAQLLVWAASSVPHLEYTGTIPKSAFSRYSSGTRVHTHQMN